MYCVVGGERWRWCCCKAAQRQSRTGVDSQAKDALYSLLTLAASRQRDSAQCVPKVSGADWFPQSLWRAACEGSDGLFQTVSPILMWCLCFMQVCVGSALRCYSSLQRVGVTLHHAGPSLPVAVLYPSVFFSFNALTLLRSAPGERSGATSGRHTAGGHHPFWRRLFRVPGRPESLKWSVLWGACREEGGHSRRQRIWVNLETYLALIHWQLNLQPAVVCRLIYMCSDLYQPISSADRRSCDDDCFLIWLQEEHHRSPVVPLLWAPAGEHLYSRAKHPRRQPRQPEESFGDCTAGLRHDKTFIP